MRSIAILASSDLKVGSGHLSRQISIAEKAVLRGWQVTLIGKFPRDQIPAPLRDFITVVGLESSSSVNEHLRALEHVQGCAKIDCAFIDNYALIGPLSSKGIRDKLPPQVQFEDGIENENVAKVIINSGIHPRFHQDFIERLNERADYSIVGPDAAIIGEKIWAIREDRERAGAKIEDENRGIINFGNSDTSQELMAVIYNLAKSPALSAISWTIIANRLDTKLNLSPSGLRITPSNRNRGASEFYSSLATCKFAIGGAGVSSYERAFLGIPSINFPLADNQTGIATILSESKAAVKGELSASWFRNQEINFVNLLQPENAKAMSKSGMSLVDGHGASRILDMSEKV